MFGSYFIDMKVNLYYCEFKKIVKLFVFIDHLRYIYICEKRVNTTHKYLI